AGHVSNRRKTKTPAPARISTTSANAAGQENFPEGAGFNIGCWTLNVGRFLQSPKKYRPPRPMGVKGGCSPQNILQNLGSYYPSLKDAATKISINYAGLLGAAGKPRGRPRGCRSRKVAFLAKCRPTLAESGDARFSFVCAIC